MAVAPLFFRKAVGAFLVYDITDKKSFEDVNRWYEQLTNSVSSQIVIMLVGNKSDRKDREVPYNVAMEYARARSFAFLETSAKNKTNVSNAYHALVREIYKNQGEEDQMDKVGRDSIRIRSPNGRDTSGSPSIFMNSTRRSRQTNHKSNCKC